MSLVGVRSWSGSLAAMLFCFCNLAAAVEITTSPNDNRNYHAFELENGLKVIVISDPGTDKAAASLEVGIGSGDNPADREGLAHFLEHMLFLGTGKYPEAGEYQSYISNHSGSHNAFTAHDRTNYFFSINSDYLEPALDRFAQFFIDPLFTPEYVEREKHAVHAEYQSKFKEDGLRGLAVFRQVVNPDHPASRFAVGNLDTLADRPGSTIRDELIDFYEQHYSADNMTLVVLGPESVEQLEKLVQTKFNAVSKRKTASPPAVPPLFLENQLPAIVKTESIRDLYQLSLNFPVPPIRQHFENKPLHYLSAVLGHEGPGSLLDTLKQRGLAKSLSAGPGFDYDDTATMFVNIGLTEKGFHSFEEIVDLTFQYLRLMSDSGIKEWIFDEERQINETAFRFRENGNAASYVTRLANNLRRYPQQEVIHGDYLFKDFDAELINDYLSFLNPENVLITLTGPEVETDRIEPWYDAAYSVTAVTPGQIENWSAGEIDPALKIAAPNPFLASDFSLRENPPSDKPEVIRTSPGYRLWFKQDQDFDIPKSDFYFTFRSPTANNSARNHILTDLYVALVKDRLNAFIYPASVAGFKMDLYPNLRGFTVRLSGFRDKQLLLLTQITEALKNLEVVPERLEIYRADLHRRLENRSKDKPYSQTMDEIYLSVLNPQWSIEAQLAELESVTADELQEFVRDLLHSGEIEALAHGNLSPADALVLSEALEKSLLEGIDVADVAQGQIRILEPQLQVRDLDIQHNDSAVSIYLQGADSERDTRAQYGLLAEILSAPFYNELRTEKQLGYIVFASSLPILEHPALALVVQSSSASPDELQRHIDQFIENSAALIASMTEEELAAYKQSLLVDLLKKDQRMSERSRRYWREIDRGYSDFNSRELLAEAIREITTEDLLKTFQGLNQRQLVVRSAGKTLSQVSLIDARLRFAV